MGKIGPANSSGYQLLATHYYSYCNDDWYGFSSGLAASAPYYISLLREETPVTMKSR